MMKMFSLQSTCAVILLIACCFIGFSSESEENSVTSKEDDLLTLHNDLTAAMIKINTLYEENRYERLQYQKEIHLLMTEISGQRKRNKKLSLERESAIQQMKKQSDLRKKMGSKMRADNSNLKALMEEFDSLAFHFAERQKRINQLDNEIADLLRILDSYQERMHLENELGSDDEGMTTSTLEIPAKTLGERNQQYKNEIQSKINTVSSLRESLRLEEINARDYRKQHERAERDLAVLQKKNHQLRENIQLLNLQFEARIEDERKIRVEIIELRIKELESEKREQECRDKYSAQLTLNGELAKELQTLRNSK